MPFVAGQSASGRALAAHFQATGITSSFVLNNLDGPAHLPGHLQEEITGVGLVQMQSWHQDLIMYANQLHAPASPPGPQCSI